LEWLRAANEMQNNPTSSEIEAVKQKPKGFALGMASAIMAMFGFFVLIAYGKLHWKIISDHYDELTPDLKAPLLSLLGLLEQIHRGLGIAALAFAISCFVKKEVFWSRIIAIAAMLISLLLVFSVM